MSLRERSEEIIDKLKAGGVRCSLDPSLTPPAVLLIWPDLVWDAGYCGITANWRAACIVPNSATFNATTLGMLEDLVGALVSVVDVEHCEAITFQLAGLSYNAYMAHWSEAFS